MNAPIQRQHAVTFPVGNTGADNIASALALVKIAAIAVRNKDDTIAEEIVTALDDVLDLAERFLSAGAAWARDAEGAITEAQYAAMRAAMDSAAKAKRP